MAVNPAKLLRNAYKHTPPNPEEEEKANSLQGFSSRGSVTEGLACMQKRKMSWKFRL